jgi:hypothetical protein
MHSIKCAVLVVGAFAGSACNGNLGYPGLFNGSAGSCTYPGLDGHDVCEDFLGTDYDSEVGQSLCSNVIQSGTWSQDPCPTAGALGSCRVVPIGTGDARTVEYTYYASPVSDAGPATTLTAKTACGVAGGTFTAN